MVVAQWIRRLSLQHVAMKANRLGVVPDTQEVISRGIANPSLSGACGGYLRGRE